MKTWEHDQIRQAANGCISGTLAEWPYLAEALTAQGVRLPLNTFSTTLQAICRLILAERKTTEANADSDEAKALQSQMLDRDIYANRHDIAQCYRDYCESFASSSWCRLSEWDCMDCTTPADYIAARVSK